MREMAMYVVSDPATHALRLKPMTVPSVAGTKSGTSDHSVICANEELWSEGDEGFPSRGFMHTTSRPLRDIGGAAIGAKNIRSPAAPLCFKCRGQPRWEALLDG